MPCYRPQRVATDEDGRLDWSVSVSSAVVDQVVLVPCRKCAGCLASQAREWAIRCVHEAWTNQRHSRDPSTGITTRLPNAAMLTLTYRDEDLPDSGVLVHQHAVDFLADLGAVLGERVRYFLAGEYGGQTGRPHFHVLVFNALHVFDDRFPQRTPDNQEVVRSLLLEHLWPYGLATIDEFNWKTARYVAGYVAKKSHVGGNFTGPLVDLVNPETGETKILAPAAEYRTMSRHPGLGADWIKENLHRVYPVDQVVIDGQEYPPPGYYDRYLKRTDPELYVAVQAVRLEGRLQNQLQWDPERCASAEAIHHQRLRGDHL